MFTVFVMSIVHLPFYQLATLYTHLMSHVLSKKIKRDFLHGRAINFDTRGEAYLSDASSYTSLSCHIACW